MKESLKDSSAQIIKILDMVLDDVEGDVNYYEGKPFTGRNVSEYFGKQAAAISAIGAALKNYIISLNETMEKLSGREVEK